MLSRVAENLYWLGRYVERAENTARIVAVNANLLLDLPRGLTPGWKPLVQISGSDALFNRLYPEADERSVVKFLVGDTQNPSSILACLYSARENTRTIRDIVQRELWEIVNGLYWYAKDNLNSGLSKRGRFAYLNHVILGSQTFTGLASGTMNHNAGYQFLRLGALLERADMTTRIIDVRSATLLPEQSAAPRTFENIQWMSVLKSLHAYQMYRQKMQVRVTRRDALRFLLLDNEFPRAFYRCVAACEARVAQLPNNETPLRALARVKRLADSADITRMAESQTQLHEYIDQLQLGLAEAHDEIDRQYYLP